MRINNNMPAINTHRQLGISAQDGAKSMEKLSSGFRINRAGDDAAGLAISEKMRGQIRGLTMASKNSSDTISLIQTAEGALSETHSILQRMRELSVQSANDTNTNEDRSELQAEIKQLKAEIDRIGNTTEFNTKKLLEGSAKGVADEIAGFLRVNNNSSVVMDPGKLSAMQNTIANDKSWAFDGAFMLIKTNQSFNGTEKVFNAADFQLVGKDGTVFRFASEGNATARTASDLLAGTIIAQGGAVRSAVADGTKYLNDALNGTMTDITLGADVNEVKVTEIGKGSTLAAGSSITFASTGGSVTIAKDISIDYSSTGVLSYKYSASGSINIGVGESLNMDNGTVIRNDGSGKFTIASGSLALDGTEGATANLSKFTIAAQSTLSAASTKAVAGTTLVEASSYQVGGGTLDVNVTVGNSVNLTKSNFSSLSAGSVLAKGSDVTINSGKTIALNVSGKEIEISYIASVLKVGDQVVAAGKSITLEDGTVLTNQASLTSGGTGQGKITVATGSVTLAKDISAEATGFNITKDSTIAAGSTILANTILAAGTVITDAAKPVFAGSVTLANGGTALQFSANTSASLESNFFGANVGDGFTFVFQHYQAASSNLGSSIMSQIGANSGQTAFVSMGDMRANALGIDQVDVSTSWGAATAIETVNNAISKVSHQRSSLGAIQNRLEHTIKNLDAAAENLQNAESRIRDVDMAKEVMENTKQTILQQAAQAMLAQANQTPQSVLALLR
jgi:flagellin